MAGAARIELASTVLETAVLPLNHAPDLYVALILYKIFNILEIKNYIFKRKIKKKGKSALYNQILI